MGALRRENERTIVVDLGRGSIKMAVAEPAGDAARFHGITQVQAPRSDGADQTAEDAALVESIGAEVEAHGWRGMPAACLLSGTAISTQSFQFPPMPQSELREALELKLSETLHFDVADAYFDFRRVKKSGATDEELTLAVAARKDAVLRGIEILRLAGLRPVAVGAASESLANLTYYARLCDDSEATVHIDVGAFSSILNLFEGRLLRFSREVDVAGESFTRALMRPIITGEGPVQLTHQQAEDVKIVAGYPPEGEDLLLPHGVRSSEVLPLLEPVAQQLTTEIRRSSDYLRGILGRGVDRILLSGSASRMRGLSDVLEENLGTPVVETDPVGRATAHWRLAVCDDNPPELLNFSAILGFSLGNHRPINLLPREVRYQELVDHATKVRKLVAPSSLALATVIGAAAIPVDRQFTKAMTEMQSAADELEARLQDASALGDELIRTAEKATGIVDARGPVPDWTGVMKELSTILPEEVQITMLSAKHESGVVTISLAARVHERTGGQGIGAVTQALSASPFFTNMRVHGATAASPGSSGSFEALLDVVAVQGEPFESKP